jgi:hypothetical protein
MMDKIKLSKLIEFIAEISQLKGNEWFKERLMSKLENNGSFKTKESIEELDILKDIKNSNYYLRSIDRKIWKEALIYYSSIKYTDLKIGLIQDYKEMKIADKNDDIIEYTRRIVMQLENCLNAICIILKSHELIKASPDKYRNNSTDLLKGDFSFFNLDGSAKQLSKVSIFSKIFFAKQYYDIFYSYSDMNQMITIRNKSSHRGEYSEREKEIIEEAKNNIALKKSSYFICYDSFWIKMNEIKK